LGLPFQPRPTCPITNPKGTEIKGLVPDERVDHSLPAMPEYRMLVTHRIGPHHVLQEGECFKFVGYPIAELMTAVNHPGRLVEAYYAEHREHPKLESRGPWCWYRGLYLPELASMRLHGQVTKAYPDGSYKPLDTRKHAAAIASEIDRVAGDKASAGLPFYSQPGSAAAFKGMRGTGVGGAGPLPEKE